MNRQRRNILHKVIDQLERLEKITDKETALTILTECTEETEYCKDDEEMALDSRPESLYWSTGTQDMMENVSDLEDAYGDLDVVCEMLKEQSKFNFKEHSSEIKSAIKSIQNAIHR